MKDLFRQDFWNELYRNVVEWAIANVPAILLTIILFLIAVKLFNYFVNRVKNHILENTNRRHKEDAAEHEKRVNTLVKIIKQAGMLLIWLVFIVMLLDKFNVEIAPIIASAGILGLAIGFGAQELVKDVITGFFILMENQIRTGDVAVINGTGGLVEKIELRTITLRDVSGVVHIFQNGKISTLSNMTKGWSAIVFDIGVAYKENVDQVMELMKEVGDQMRSDEAYKSKITEPIEVFGLDKFGDSALIIKARLKTKPGDQWAVGREYRRRLKQVFDAQKIEIPFPHLSVYWGEEINPLKLEVDKRDN